MKNENYTMLFGKYIERNIDNTIVKNYCNNNHIEKEN